jgi:hypothetical protein
MNRTRREWGLIFLGLAAGFLLGEVKLLFQPNAAAAWVLAVLTLACVATGLFLLYGSGQNRE